MKARYLQALLYLRRQGGIAWGLSIVWLLVLSLACALLMFRNASSEQAEEISLLQQEYQNSLFNRQLAIASKDGDSTNSSEFQKILGKSEQLQSYQKAIFQIAEKKGLNLSIGNYKANNYPTAGYESYVLEFPVTGTYQSIKEFSEEVLLALPFSALEEMKFKRDAASGTTLDVHLKFVLFLQPIALSSGGKPDSKRGF